MMAPPKGPKRIAAEEQLAAMLAAKLPEEEIRQALMEAGLTKLQVNQIYPSAPVVDNTPPRVVDDDIRNANINGAVHFLETVAKHLTPSICDRFNELGPLKGDALTWARKLKGVM